MYASCLKKAITGILEPWVYIPLKASEVTWGMCAKWGRVLSSFVFFIIFFPFPKNCVSIIKKAQNYGGKQKRGLVVQTLELIRSVTLDHFFFIFNIEIAKFISNSDFRETKGKKNSQKNSSRSNSTRPRKGGYHLAYVQIQPCGVGSLHVDPNKALIAVIIQNVSTKKYAPLWLFR